jgi:MoaA/NifB/PqqE/SkfB family radical SAM enzyme
MAEPRTLPVVEYGEFSRKVHDHAAHRDRVIKAQLELTYRCNLHCRHCYTDPYNHKDYVRRELSLTEIQRLLDDMRDLGIMWLNLTGGDIFMHPDFFEIYEAAHRRGFLLQLYTNGTLFTRAIVERLQAIPPFTIDISLHSVTEERFDWFTQVPGSFRSFMRGMDLLRASRLPLSFKTKVMNWNKDELPHIRAFVESFGQRFSPTTSLSPRLNGDCSSLDHRLPPDEVAALEGLDLLCDQVQEACGSDDVGAPPGDRLFRCGCATDTIHISAWGELGTCTLQYEHRASLRDYSLADAIAKVFEVTRSARYQSLSACRSCDLHVFCDKKPSDARWEYGSPQEPIPYCCDVALARAEATAGRRLIHPLRCATR